MSLARSEGSSQRFYSMSAQIREERGDYYGILERTQKGTMDVTPWMEWFLSCLTGAIEGAQGVLSGVIAKARYSEKLRDVPLNERQRLLINRMLEGFEGKLSTSKWAALTKSSQDTALREWIAPTIFIGSMLWTQNPMAVAVALGVLDSYASDFLKGRLTSKKVKVSFVVERRKGKTYARVTYEGAASRAQGLSRCASKRP
jgi:hypothetical protein